MSLVQAILWCCVMASLTGCQKAPPPQAFRVEGRLFIDNNLASHACIAFHPVDHEKSQGRCPVAMTKQDGSFELTTYTLHDGAPEGDYAVTVTWLYNSILVDECEGLDLLQHDRLRGKYADPQTSTLQVTILPQENYINLCAESGQERGKSL
jgi:hypothetical protein